MAKKLKKLASALSSVSKSIGKPISVVSSAGVDLENKGALKTFACQSCSTVAGYNVPEPFCVTCGSAQLSEVDGQEPEELKDGNDQSLSSVKCTNCGSNNIMSDTVASTMGGHIHCAACGYAIKYVVAEADDGKKDDADAGDGTSPGAIDTTKQETADSSPEDDTVVLDEISDDDDDNIGEGDDDPNPPPEDDTELNLLNQASPKGAFSAFIGGGKVWAAVDDLPVAVKDPDEETAEDKAGDGTEAAPPVAKDDSYKTQRSIIKLTVATVQELGIHQGLKKMGFTPLVVKSSVSQLVKVRTQAATASLRKQMEQEKAELRDAMTQTLQIAAVGMNKGFWPDRTNPLKATMYEVLQQANVRNPEKLVDSVFSSAGDQYNEELLAQADELMGKSPEVLNELAAALKVSNYLTAEVEGDTDDEDGEDVEAVESRLMGKHLAKANSRRKEISSLFLPTFE